MASVSLLTLPLTCLPQTYSVVRIGRTPDNKSSAAVGINDKGLVLINAARNDWVWTKQSNWTVIHNEMSSEADWFEISESGHVAGWARDQSAQVQIGTWSPPTGILVYIGVLGGQTGWANGLNNRGQFVGQTQKPNWNTGYLYTPGQGFVDVPAPGGGEAPEPEDVSDDGLVVGRYLGPGTRAFTWTATGGSVPVPMVPDAITMDCAFASNTGTVWGHVWHGPEHPWYRLPGETQLHYVSGANGFVTHWAYGINDHDDFVGRNGTMTIPHPTYWRFGWPQVKWLDTMLDGTAAGWVIEEAQDLNNKGQIATWGKYMGATQTEAILLEPKTLRQNPTGVEVQAGRTWRPGPLDLESVFERDGNGLAVAPFAVPNAMAAPVSIVVSAKLPKSAYYLWLTTVSRSSQGAARQRLSLWDFKAGKWDEKDSAAHGLGAAWSDSEVVARWRVPGRYTGPNREVKARIEAWPTTLDPSWRYELDLAQWVYVE